MHVLHVMATGQTSGGAQHLLALLPALVARGVQVTALVGDDGPLASHLLARGVAAEARPLMGTRLSPRAALALRGFLRRRPPDLVHFHGTRAAVLGAMQMLRAPSLYTVHGLSYRKEKALWRRSVFIAAEGLGCRRAERVLAVARADADDLVRRGLVARARIVHLPNPLDLTRLRPEPQSAARAALGVPAAGRLVGTVARLVAGKAVGELIAAVAPLANTHLVVAGDGPEAGALRARARALGVSAFFLGERDDIGRILSALDVFALTSHWEGEPLAVLEALAMGTTIVATATSGAREIIRGAEGASLVPIGDVRALSAALGAADGSTPDTRSLRRERARAALVERAPERVAARLVEIYDDLRRRERVG